MTIDEAIKILRQHNQTNVSVLRITGGRCLEHDLLEQVLNAYEQIFKAHVEARRLLKLAVENMNDGGCTRSCSTCKYGRNGCKYTEGYEWIHTDEALKLLGEDGDTA